MSAKIAEAIQVNGLERFIRPPPCSRRKSSRPECSRPASRSVSSTQSIPNAQPPITSLGQWTPSITRLMPIRNDKRIAPAAAARCQRVPAVSARARASGRRSSSSPHGRSGRMRFSRPRDAARASGRARAIQYFCTSLKPRPTSRSAARPRQMPVPGPPQPAAQPTSPRGNQHGRLAEGGEDARDRRPARAGPA